MEKRNLQLLLKLVFMLVQLLFWYKLLQSFHLTLLFHTKVRV